MRDNGIDQWDEDYPNRAVIERDLETKTLFAYREHNEIIGIVVLNETQDEEYKEMNCLPVTTIEILSFTDWQFSLITKKRLVEYLWTLQNSGHQQQLRCDSTDTYSQTLETNDSTDKEATRSWVLHLQYKKEHPYYCYNYC